MSKAKLFRRLVDQAGHIVISTHLMPDADGIGSQIALSLALRAYGKSAICVNEEPLLERYHYMDAQRVVVSAQAYQKEYGGQGIDLFIVVDTNSAHRIGPKAQGLLESARNVLFIDHHPCSAAIEAIHCIDTHMAATGQLVGNLIHAMGIELTQEMALPLYTSILIDTSSFRYPTVTGDTHRLLADLVEAGVDPPDAYNQIYGTKKISHMRLLGKVLSTASTTQDEAIAWLVIREEDLDQFSTDPEDTHAFINHLLILDNVQVACMFRNHGKFVKISFRSDGRIDVGDMAQALGGGGHNHSAATIIEGDLDQVVNETVNKLQVILDSMGR